MNIKEATEITTAILERDKVINRLTERNTSLSGEVERLKEVLQAKIDGWKQSQERCVDLQAKLSRYEKIGVHSDFAEYIGQMQDKLSRYESIVGNIEEIESSLASQNMTVMEYLNKIIREENS